MKSIITKAGLLAAAFIVSAGSPARAAAIEVTVPFPFLVHNRIMPAGEYRVENTGEVVLLREEKSARTSMFVLTTPADGRDPMGNTPALVFMRHETTYRLADIWESDSQGQAIVRPSGSSSDLAIPGAKATR